MNRSTRQSRRTDHERERIPRRIRIEQTTISAIIELHLIERQERNRKGVSPPRIYSLPPHFSSFSSPSFYSHPSTAGQREYGERQRGRSQCQERENLISQRARPHSIQTAEGECHHHELCLSLSLIRSLLAHSSFLRVYLKV